MLVNLTRVVAESPNEVCTKLTLIFGSLLGIEIFNFSTEEEWIEKKVVCINFQTIWGMTRKKRL